MLCGIWRWGFLSAKPASYQPEHLHDIDEVLILQVGHVVKSLIILEPLRLRVVIVFNISRLAVRHVLLPHHGLVDNVSRPTELLASLGVTAVEESQIQWDKPGEEHTKSANRTITNFKADATHNPRAPTRANMTRFAIKPGRYSGASLTLYSRGPMMLPVHMPTKTTAEVVFFLVSPAVFWADQA